MTPLEFDCLRCQARPGEPCAAPLPGGMYCLDRMYGWVTAASALQAVAR